MVRLRYGSTFAVSTVVFRYILQLNSRQLDEWRQLLQLF